MSQRTGAALFMLKVKVPWLIVSEWVSQSVSESVSESVSHKVASWAKNICGQNPLTQNFLFSFPV